MVSIWGSHILSDSTELLKPKLCGWCVARPKAYHTLGLGFHSESKYLLFFGALESPTEEYGILEKQDFSPQKMKWSNFKIQ